jgi:hypothetical protein
MPVIVRSPRFRPHGAPAYYLARPASVWITALHRQPPTAPERPAGSGTTCQPEGTAR